MSEVRSEADAIGQLAREGTAGIRSPDPEAVHVAVLPYEQARVEVLDLEQHLGAPRRKRGSYHPSTVLSFAEYVGEHHHAQSTTIWIDRSTPQVVAVLNDHSTEAPAWRDHRATLKLERTPEWRHWLSKDGRLLAQQEFAEHLEDGVREIRHPSAADMLEIAQSIQGSVGAEFKAGRRLQSGEVALQYVETAQVSAGRRGELEIPATFTIGVAPFHGEKPVEIAARLRYRLASGAVTLGYRLERPVDAEMQCLGDIHDRLAKDFPRVYMGVPSA